MPAPAWLTAKPIAHRGLHGPGRPENSLAAIEAALTAGFPVEIDLRLTADGRAVVFHDADLARLTGLSKKVADVPSGELANLRLQGSAEKIPLLEDVLDLTRGREGLLIEIKSGGPGRQLEEIASGLLKAYRGDFAIQSFDPNSLAWFRKNAPKVPRGQLSSGWDRADAKTIFLGNYALNWMSRPHFIAHDRRRLPSVATKFLRGMGWPLLAWTVRSQAERESALAYADNMIFEQFCP